MKFVYKRSIGKEVAFSFFLGFDKIAELLIENGADVNIVGNNDLTPLMYAADKGWYSSNYVLNTFKCTKFSSPFNM